jgi:hypothetical protein
MDYQKMISQALLLPSGLARLLVSYCQLNPTLEVARRESWGKVDCLITNTGTDTRLKLDGLQLMINVHGEQRKDSRPQLPFRIAPSTSHQLFPLLLVC